MLSRRCYARRTSSARGQVPRFEHNRTAARCPHDRRRSELAQSTARDILASHGEIQNRLAELRQLLALCLKF